MQYRRVIAFFLALGAVGVLLLFFAGIPLFSESRAQAGVPETRNVSVAQSGGAIDSNSIEMVLMTQNTPEGIACIEDWIDLFRCVQLPRDRALYFDILLKKVLESYGSLEEFVSRFADRVEGEQSLEYLGDCIEALWTFYELLPSDMRQEGNETLVLVTLFHACERYIERDASSITSWSYVCGYKLLPAMERKQFPLGVSREELLRIRSELPRIKWDDFWRRAVQSSIDVLSTDEIREDEVRKIDTCCISSLPKSWYVKPIRGYEKWSALRLLKRKVDDYGESYVDFLEAGGGFPSDEQIEQWLPAKLWMCLCMSRRDIARTESNLLLLTSVIDAELALREGKSIEAVTELASAYRDGYYGNPLRFRQSHGVNSMLYRCADHKTGLYSHTIEYEWPSQ